MDGMTFPFGGGCGGGGGGISDDDGDESSDCGSISIIIE